VIERYGTLEGYELYLVEQWACSRIHPTFIITAYTGDPKHTLKVGVLGVPTREEAWSPRLRVYFKAIAQFHAREKDTPLGTLMVTNLSSFPSALTVIPVPDGDIKKHRDDFVVNEDLKRLGCSGRSGMSLSAPAPATQAKFFQLYKTSDRIPLYGAVIELVKLCQVALMIFGKLDQEYCDGTLCDITEKAITVWWTDIGSDYYNIEPTDGILGPTTVAALLGLLMGARNRLNYLGAPVAKDVFDVYALKRGISSFQKAQKIERTRRLDRQTLNILHNVTAKAAAGEGWGVPKAIKSTVTELGGKGGEMVMGMVGRGDKAGIGDIETLDIDQFVSLVHGQRAKWLWYGKAKRSGGHERDEPSILSFTKDDQGGYIWSHTRASSLPPIEDERRKEVTQNSPYSGRPTGSATSILESPGERDPQLRKTVFKSVTGKMSDARSGFGRIKDAVGLRGHSSRPSRDDGLETGYFTPQGSATGLVAETPISPARVGKAFTWKDTPGQYQNGVLKVKETQSMPVALEGSQSPEIVRPDVPTIVTNEETEADRKWTEQIKEVRRDLVYNDPSIEGSAYGDLEGPLLEATRESNNFQILLHRRHSISSSTPARKLLRNEEWWPRRMSFSSAEDAVFGWTPIGADFSAEPESDDWAALQKQKNLSMDLKNLYEKISVLQDDLAPWIEAKLASVEKQDEAAVRDQEEFRDVYYQLSEQYQAVKENSEDTINEERHQLNEGVAIIEGLVSKLEYEINTVLGKVNDMEDGVLGFETQVEVLELKARDLELQLGTESWPHWFVRTLTGIGTGPNVINPRSSG
jgi:hypothetical protein